MIGPYAALSHRFTVTASAMVEVALRPLLVDLLDPQVTGVVRAIEIDRDPAAPGDAMYAVTLDGDPVYRTLREGSLVSHLLIHMNQSAVQATTDRFVLHAGAVAGRSGAVVLPGASHSGKTTLTAALALAGCTFVADEVCAIEPSGLTVAPYGKPVALRPMSQALLAPLVATLWQPPTDFERDERFVAPHALGGLAMDDQPVARIVFPQFVAGARPTLTPLGSAEALERLLRCVLGEHSLSKSVFRRLEQLVRTVPAHRIEFGNALEAAELIVDLR